MEQIQRVEVCDILAARDERKRRQEAFLSAWHVPLISFTLNIPGPVKFNPLIHHAFEEGRRRIRACLKYHEWETLAYDEQVAFTGCEALWAVACDAAALKAALCLLEEQDALGRLFDMDVIDADGQHLSRQRERSCFICGGPVRVCARNRVHSVQQLFQKTEEVIQAHFVRKLAGKTGELCQRALMYELMTTPKPGLVDLDNNGIHTDMNPGTFADSICILRSYFEDCVWLGHRGAGYEALRLRALDAEKEMYRTVNVNTHKGAIFSLGILSYAVGCVGVLEDTDTILQHAAACGKFYLDEMIREKRNSTGGERQYLEFGLTGARGEAASGYESVKRYALPVLESRISNGMGIMNAGVYALLALMAHVQDSNVIRKGGIEAQKWMQHEAANLLKRGCSPEDMRIMNDQFVLRGISPGGCADLLAVAYFIYLLRQEKDGMPGFDE